MPYLAINAASCSCSICSDGGFAAAMLRSPLHWVCLLSVPWEMPSWSKIQLLVCELHEKVAFIQRVPHALTHIYCRLGDSSTEY